jgi:hypothetical protein
MTSRIWLVIPVLAFAFLASEASAQGGGNNGPAFCRSGQGHPVHGWAWCEARGWERSRGRVWRDDRRTDRTARRDDLGRRSTIGTRGYRTDLALDNGYADGYDKGLEDAGKTRDFDPTRHGWYKSGDRGYDSDYGTKASYKNTYREGFRQGYQAGFNDRERNDRRGTTTGSARQRWPF